MKQICNFCRYYETKSQNFLQQNSFLLVFSIKGFMLLMKNVLQFCWTIHFKKFLLHSKLLISIVKKIVQQWTMFLVLFSLEKASKLNTKIWLSNFFYMNVKIRLNFSGIIFCKIFFLELVDLFYFYNNFIEILFLQYKLKAVIQCAFFCPYTSLSNCSIGM